MANPLQKLFKKLFIGNQDKQKETLKATLDEKNKLDAEAGNLVKEIESLVEEIDEALYIDLEVRPLTDYIYTKAYEEKIMRLLQERGIKNTKALGTKAVQFILAQAGGQVRAKAILAKFKGYIPFKIVEALFTEEEWESLEPALEWKINIEILPPYQDVKIKEVFQEMAYEPLWKLAKIKEITTLGEIQGSFLASYKNYTGVGEKKYLKTLEQLSKYAQADTSFSRLGIVQKESLNVHHEIHIENHLYELFHNYSLGQIALIYGLDLERGIKTLKLKGLQDKTLEEVINPMYRPMLENGLEKINHLIVPSLAFESFKDKLGMEVLRHRYIEGLSLEETATLLNISREETGKIQIRALEVLTELLRTSKFVEILSSFNKGDSHIPLHIVEKVVGEKNTDVLELIKHNAFHDLGYNPIFEMVFLNAETSEEELMEKLSQILPHTFKLEDYKAQIEKAIEGIGIVRYNKKVLSKLLEVMGYKLYDKLYSKEEVSSTFVLEKTFKDKIKKPLYLDEEAIEFLDEEAQKNYKHHLKNNLISLEQTLSEIPEILQVGSNTYLHHKHLKLKETVLESIRTYLKEVETTQEKVNIHKLYADLKPLLKGSKIQDQYGLRSVISYYFGDVYPKEDLNKAVNWNGLDSIMPRLRQLISKALDEGSIEVETFLQDLLKEEPIAVFLKENQLEDNEALVRLLNEVDSTLKVEANKLYR